MFPDDGSRSPIKRTKGKFPDIERALSVWARNTRKAGIPLTDEKIREKARFFATSVGISDSHFKANSAGWLEKFKHKNNLHANGRGRSESDVTGAGRRSIGGSSNGGGGESPAMSLSRSQQSHEGTTAESPEAYIDFAAGIKAYQREHPHSSSSGSATSTSFAQPTSPGSPFFSPTSSQHSPHPHRLAHLQRPRSHTLPLLTMDPSYISPPPSSEPLTPKMGVCTSQMEAKAALEVVMSFLRTQPGFVEQEDFMVVGKLLGRLGIEDAAGATPGGEGEGQG